MTVGFPIFWVLGLANFVFIILAIPMAWQLRAKRPLRLPRGFAFWGLLLLWVLLSAGTLSLHAPGTLSGSTTHRLDAFTVRFLNYVAQTVLLLYIGNHTEKELPRLKIVRWLGIFFLYTAIGGVAGMIAPHFSFDTPLQFLPHSRSLLKNPNTSIYIHPGLAQVQSVLGHSAPRPKAPFDYTNVWGSNLTVLAVFFVIGWWTYGSRRQRQAVVPMLLIALVPYVYSLDRGAWIGAGILVLYVGARLGARGNFRLLAGIGAAVAVALLVVALSPLHTVVSQRFAHPKSNQIRTNLSTDAYVGAKSSPVLGFGTTRQVIGSGNSIAIGKTTDCNSCGNAQVGSNGVFWLTLFSQGFLGVGFYTLFFVVVAVRGRRDPSPLGLAASGVVIVSLFFNFFYSGAGSALTLYMFAVGLLWRNEQIRRAGGDVALDVVAA